MPRHPSLSAVLALSLCLSPAAVRAIPCEPPDGVQAILDQAAELRESCGQGAECWGKQRLLLVSALEDRPDERRASLRENYLCGSWSLRLLLAEADLELERFDEMRSLLLEMEEDLEAHEPAEDAEDDKQAIYRHFALGFWQIRARLADREDRKLDAVVYYRTAHSFSPQDGEDLVRATELWEELAGGLGELGTSRWTDRGEALAAFELADLAGKTWRLGDFEGKTVFANIWATWCGPCRLELPFVQELYDKLADHPDTVVVTLNIDQDPGLVVPYMEKNELTFPVLHAASYVQELWNNAVSIPRNWIVDGEGTLLKEQTGFNPKSTADEWIGEVMQELGKVTAE